MRLLSRQRRVRADASRARRPLLSRLSRPLAGTLDARADARSTEWKAVYGRVEAATPCRRARASAASSLISPSPKATGRRRARTSPPCVTTRSPSRSPRSTRRSRALQSQLATAETELTRGEALVEQGRGDGAAARPAAHQVDVTRNQLAAAEAQRSVVVQQGAEGEVLAPGDGRVLTVPVTRGAVILAGEPIATIGGGGFFLRLAIPERHAATLKEGAADPHRPPDGARSQPGGSPRSIRRSRTAASSPTSRSTASTTPSSTRACWSRSGRQRRARCWCRAPPSTTRSGIDFVTRRAKAAPTTARAVVLGEALAAGRRAVVEVLTGLASGDVVVMP